jgi:hypothetical protein
MKRIYKLQGTLTNATGLMGYGYKNSQIVATMTIEARKNVFDTFNGQATVSGVIVSATDKNGKNISISGFGSGTKLSPRFVNITSKDIVYTIDDKKTNTTITASFDDSGKNITTFKINVIVKGFLSFLANNLVIDGTGILTQEILDEVIPPNNTQKSDLSKPLKGVRIADGWSKQDPMILASSYKNAGCNVLGFEIMEYITSGDLNTIQKQQIDKLVAYKKACDAFGLWFEVCTNTNDVLNPRNNTQTILDRHYYLAQKIGNDIIIQPASETASPNIDWKKVRIEASKLFPYCAQYTKMGVDGKWIEAHPCSVGAGLCGLPPNPSSYICTDCTPMMSNNMVQDALVNFAKSIISQNVSFSFYGTLPSLSTTLANKAFNSSNQTNPPSNGLDELNIANHRSGYKGTSRNRADTMNVTKTLTGASINGDKLTFDKVDRSSWPIVTEKKACNAKAWMFWVEADGTVFGDHWEWIGTTQNVKGLENITGGILKDSKGVTHIPPKGSTIYVCQASTNYKERTNVVKVKGTWQL